LPVEAYTGSPLDQDTLPGIIPKHMQMPEFDPPRQHGPPMPAQVYGSWKPPGIAMPWPEEEFLFDGGDTAPGVVVRQDWRVDGLNLEDTVAHFDTLDGRTLVTPSNRVCLYAPRFASVRRVDNVYEGEQHERAGRASQNLALVGFEERLPVGEHMQPVQPIGDVGTKRVTIYEQKDRGLRIEQVLVPIAIQDRVKPYENFLYIKLGVIEEAEKPFIAKAAQAAIVWTKDQAVQILMEGRRAQAEVGTQRPQIEYRVDLPNNPRLLLCKIASEPTAAPGEEVDFTIRFDNTGDVVIGNVTIIDSLTTRLEYVPNSAQSSVKANFSTSVNEGDSTTLRWEILEPLKPGDGGLVRFKTIVR
jgi:uncharacterized repeat protein (TIGR01451 family)